MNDYSWIWSKCDLTYPSTNQTNKNPEETFSTTDRWFLWIVVETQAISVVHEKPLNDCAWWVLLCVPCIYVWHYWQSNIRVMLSHHISDLVMPWWAMMNDWGDDTWSTWMDIDPDDARNKLQNEFFHTLKDEGISLTKNVKSKSTKQ
jgi:hypothetical protein